MTVSRDPGTWQAAGMVIVLTPVTAVKQVAMTAPVRPATSTRVGAPAGAPVIRAALTDTVAPAGGRIVNAGDRPIPVGVTIALPPGDTVRTNVALTIWPSAPCMVTGGVMNNSPRWFCDSALTGRALSTLNNTTRIATPPGHTIPSSMGLRTVRSHRFNEADLGSHEDSRPVISTSAAQVL